MWKLFSLILLLGTLFMLVEMFIFWPIVWLSWAMSYLLMGNCHLFSSLLYFGLRRRRWAAWAWSFGYFCKIKMIIQQKYTLRNYLCFNRKKRYLFYFIFFYWETTLSYHHKRCTTLNPLNWKLKSYAENIEPNH